MKPRPSDSFASLALFVAASAWGLYWYPLREMEGLGVTGTWAVAYFNFFPGAVLLPYIFWNAGTQLRHWPKALAIALAAGIGLGLYASSMVLTSVIRATFLFYLTPVWATIIGVVWLRERLNAGRYLAIGGGLAGLGLLLGGGSVTSVPLNPGDFLALGAGVLWGLGAAMMKRWPEAPVATTSAAQFLVAVVLCVLAALIFAPETAPSLGALRAAFPISFGASTFVLLPSIFVIFWASRIVYPGRGGILMMSEVMVAILSASILLPEESLSVQQWLGGATVLVACIIEVRSGARGG